MISVGEVLRRIDDINRTVYRLRAGYLKHHPEAPPTEYERRQVLLKDEMARVRERGTGFRV